MSSPADQPVLLTPEAEARIAELQAAINQLRVKADKAADADIREGFQIQISKMGMKVALLRKGEPETLPSEIEKEVELEGEVLPKPSEAQLEEADKLIQRAMLEKRRGNRQQATDLLKQATQVAPGAASVLEALGDDLVERQQWAAAHEAYRNAHRADPKNPNIERKFASLAATSSVGMSFEDQMRMSMSDSAFLRPEDALASPKIATILAFFIPGAGQFVLGHTKKGFVVFLTWVVSVSLFFGVPYLVHLKGSLPVWAYLPLAVAAGAWVTGIADTTSMSKAVERKAVNRPMPPSNLPFE